jgi:hypothetical protein
MNVQRVYSNVFDSTATNGASRAGIFTYARLRCLAASPVGRSPPEVRGGQPQGVSWARLRMRKPLAAAQIT